MRALGPCLVAFAALGWAGAAAQTAAPRDCEPVGNARPVCGFRNPEDLALLPDGRTVIASEYGSSDGTVPGALASFDLRTEERRVLTGDGVPGPEGERWGDPRCPGPPSALSPHGIDASVREGGAVQLLVVQHAERDTVEHFEVVPDGDGVGLVWRGCVRAPDDARLNDVVALPGGGIAATKMYARTGGRELMNRALEGRLGRQPTGHALVWRPSRGWSAVPGTELALPNGIEVSPDGSRLYVNSSLGDGLRVIDLERGAVVARIDLPGLDNSTWAPDGRLLVASISSVQQVAACSRPGTDACPVAFRIVALDPDSLTAEVLYDAGPEAPLGAGTVGLQVGDELLIGSYSADRIVRVQLPRGSAR